MLDEGADHAQVVVAQLGSGERVQGILRSKGEGVLLAREAVGHLCSNSRLFVHRVVVRRSETVPFVVPEKRSHSTFIPKTTCSSCMDVREAKKKDN